MAVKQNLRGDYTKIYEIVNSFNKGYNTSVADDILNESYFRDLNNFIPSEEGNITKRPGINKIGLYEFFDELTNNLSAYDIDLSVKGVTNDPDVTEETLQDIGYLFRNLFQMSPLIKVINKMSTGSYKEFTSTFIPNKLANFTITEYDGFPKNLKNFKDLLNDEEAFKTYNTFSFIVIFVGSYKETYEEDGVVHDYTAGTPEKALRIINVSIRTLGSATRKDLAIEYEIKQPYRPDLGHTACEYDNSDIIDFAVYADNYYFMNGLNAIIRIAREVDADKDIEETITEIRSQDTYAGEEKLYKPTAIEVKNIGFNVAASSPLTYIDQQSGASNSIKGIFYTYNDEPTQIIPYNKEFKIHVLSSGSGENQIPEYRPNNGEIDESVNPYTKMQGSYNSDKSIFTCTGLNESESMELRIKKGTGDSADTFLAYFTMGSVIQSDIGKISEISGLLLRSKYCKIINSQLVLYGGHGYIFFSDFNNFTYFPNYYYVYIADDENEEVVSINYFRQYYAIFTNKKIKRMTGAFGSDDFGIYPLNDFIGCTNPLAIKQVQNYLYFLSYNGLYMLKQGYIGEGTENVEQIDLPIYKSYLTENMLKGVTFLNYYALFSENEAILYNYTNDAYYKFKTANTSNTAYSIPFQYNKLQNILFYGVEEDIDVTTKHFDICIQDFNNTTPTMSDNGVSFVSNFETCYMSFNAPTNIKKFKEVYLKFYNKYGKFIPLYVTIKVDDKTVVSPDNYVVSYDKDTNTYYYNEVIESNKELKGYRPLGEMKLGEDILGERTSMVLKLKVRAKGRAIKVIVSDGIEEGNKGYKTVQNNDRFDLATIGVVYKLKKVKEV